MKAIAIEIMRLVDDSGYPPLVECHLVDAEGQAHRFIEKDAVVTTRAIEAFPSAGTIACEVESAWVDSEGRALVRAATTRPWGVESTAGVSRFVVLGEQVREV